MISYIGSQQTSIYVNNTQSYSLTIPSNCTYVVVSSIGPANGNAALTATVGGNSLSTLYSINTGASGNVVKSVWIGGLANPPTGSVTLSGDYASGFYQCFHVLYFSGVKASSNVGSSGYDTTPNTVATTGVSKTITPNKADSVIIATCNMSSTSIFPSMSGATEVLSTDISDGNYSKGRTGYWLISDTSSKTVSESWSSSYESSLLAVVEIYAESAVTANAIFFGTNM